jgi:cohesin complex subunit SCC1
MNRDNSDILTAERYIPANAEIVRLREIMDDPASHFLPTLKMGGDVMFYAGPQDLAPELASLFTFPANILRKRQEEGAEDDRIAKRQRVEAVEDPVEVERRVSVVPSAHDFPGGEDSGFFARDPTMEPDMPLPDFEDVPMVTPTRSQRVRSPSLAPSRAESIAREIQNQRSTGDHMLAMFEKDATAESQSQVQSTPTKSLISEPVSRSSAGYSKNTGMAMGLLRREIEAIEDEDKVVGLAQIADKVCYPVHTHGKANGQASKRAASAFFFELLVLGTRDAIKLGQKTAFGDIDIRAKDKLFAEIAA